MTITHQVKSAIYLLACSAMFCSMESVFCQENRDKDKIQRAFDEYRLAFETGKFEKCVKRLSLDLKRKWLLESLLFDFDTGSLAKIFKKHIANTDLPQEFAKRKKAGGNNSDLLVELIEKYCDVDKILSECLPIMIKARPNFEPALQDLKVSDKEATAKVVSLVYSSEARARKVRRITKENTTFRFKKIDGVWKISKLVKEK